MCNHLKLGTPYLGRTSFQESVQAALALHFSIIYHPRLLFSGLGSSTCLNPDPDPDYPIGRPPTALACWKRGDAVHPEWLAGKRRAEDWTRQLCLQCSLAAPVSAPIYKALLRFLGTSFGAGFGAGSFGPPPQTSSDAINSQQQTWHWDPAVLFVGM